MKQLILLILIISLLSCNQQQAQQLPESSVIAVVGEEIITSDLLKAFMYVNGISQANESMVNQALEVLVDEVAMAQIAKKKQLKMSAEQLNQLKYLQIRTQAVTAKEDYLLDNVITEEEIKSEYNKANQQAGGLQFHVHHMLFDDEIEAITQLDAIKSPSDYQNQQESYLTKNSDKKNVGDLGWVALGQLPKSFREVLPDAKENSVLTQVLNSQFGAHIVYLEEVRLMQPPNYEDVKQGIINTLKTKKLSQFSQLARAKSKVAIKD